MDYKGKEPSPEVKAETNREASTMGTARSRALASLDGPAPTPATTRAVLRESVEATSPPAARMRSWTSSREKPSMVPVKRIYMPRRSAVGSGDGTVGDGVGDTDDDDAVSANRGDG